MIIIGGNVCLLLSPSLANMYFALSMEAFRQFKLKHVF